MSRYITEEWDRRKRYLIRSLFDNIPLLSPTPEVQELSSELTPVAADYYRPYSPLPELIIEKEPNRHDESEEYYEALKENVIKIYKKWFLHKRVSVEDEEQSFNDLEDQNLEQISGVEVETQAEIHHIGDNQNVDGDLVHSQHTDQDIHSDEEFELQGSELSEDAVSSHQTEPLDEPEIMRRRNTTSRPKDSITIMDHESYISGDSAKEVEKIFTKEIEEAEELSLNLTGNVQTSTPTAEIEELQYNQQNGCSKRRTLSRISLDEIILSPKRIRFDNLATQTSFSSSCEDCSLQELVTPFFLGKQSVFKLCRCRNHVCH